jgi:hypothetical protein
LFKLLLKMSFLPNTYSGFSYPWDRGNYFSATYGYSSAGIRTGFFNVNNVLVKKKDLWADKMRANRPLPDMEMYFNKSPLTRAMQVDEGILRLGSSVVNDFLVAGIGKEDPGKNPKPYVGPYAYLRNLHYNGNKADGDKNRFINLMAMGITQAIPKSFDQVFYNAIFANNYVKQEGDTTTGDNGAVKTYIDDCVTAVKWDIDLTLPTTADEAIALRQTILAKFYAYTDMINKDTNGKPVNQGVQRTFVVPKQIVRKFKLIADRIPNYIPFKGSAEMSQFPWNDADDIFRLSDDIVVIGLDPSAMPDHDITGDNYKVALFTYPDTFQIGIQDLDRDEIFYDTGLTPEEGAAFVGMIRGAKQAGNPYAAYAAPSLGLDTVPVSEYEGANWGKLSKQGFEQLQGVFGGSALMFPPTMLDLLFEGRPLSDDPDHSKEGVFSAEYTYSAIRTRPLQMLPVYFKESDLSTYSLPAPMRYLSTAADTSKTVKTKK